MSLQYHFSDVFQCSMCVTPQSINRVSTSRDNSGVCWTIFARNRDTAVPEKKEMATYRHWSVCLWRDPDDVPHCRILSPDKTEWWLISATLCRWRLCFVADQLWFMSRIREEGVTSCVLFAVLFYVLFRVILKTFTIFQFYIVVLQFTFCNETVITLFWQNDLFTL